MRAWIGPLLGLALGACAEPPPAASPPPSPPADGQALLDAGELGKAADVAAAMRTADPKDLAGYFLGAKVLRARHDRPGAAKLLEAAYAVDSRNFAMLPEYVDHQLWGENAPAKGYKALAFLDAHEAKYPDEHRRVAEARLVAYSYLLGQKGLAEDERTRLEEATKAALDAFQIQGAGTTEEHYDRAQALLSLQRDDEAIAEARAGIAAGTNTWDVIVMQFAIVGLELHQGKADDAWKDLDTLHTQVEAWRGTHFGMGKPLVEFMRLTARERFGKDLAPPADYAARLARLDAEHVTLQYGDADTRTQLDGLFVALDAGDSATAGARADDALTLLARDRGCTLENRAIRPNSKAMLLAVKGDALQARGDAAGAQAAYAEAQAIFPADPWFAEKAKGVTASRKPAP